MKYDVGGAALFGVGYGFGNGFRVQIGPSILYNKVKNVSLTDFPYNGGKLPAGNGGLLQYGAMAALYYDFNFGLPIYPYIGVGAGYQRISLSPAAQGVATYDHVTYNTKLGGHQGSFSYMGAVGVTFPIASVPGLGVTLEYRFMGLASTPKFQLSATEKFAGVRFRAQAPVNFGPLYDNIVTLGLRYQWNNPQPVPPAPAPAPMAAPAPAPAKTYLVFFDWDKASLTPRATDIIAQAASDSKTQQTTTIAVNGYTDTSGTPTYNQGLSVRRANAVAAQLVADGVPSSEITAQGFGENDLLVATGPGVREPQNRRVQIVLN